MDGIRDSSRRFKLSSHMYNFVCASGCSATNVVVSPLSAEYALLMAYFGAKGNTQMEIGRVLGLDTEFTAEDLAASYKRLKEDEKEKVQPGNEEICLEYYKLHLANGAFTDESISTKREYMENLEKICSAACFPVSFLTAPSDAVLAINDYVEKQTVGKVFKLLDPLDITELTKLVLVSALYFKANWHQTFCEEYTRSKPFRTLSGEQLMVEMMYIRTDFNFCKSKKLGGAKVLHMPYVEGVCSAIFILPKRKKLLFSHQSLSGGLQRLRDLLTPSNLADAIQQLEPVDDVTVELPKFHVEQNLDMEKMLSFLGMPTAFSVEQANFSGICENAPLHIAKVMQKAYIDVNEKGTEAAAATAVIMETCAGFPNHKKASFRANRPFLFLIRHDKSDSVLFVGHVSNPLHSQDI